MRICIRAAISVAYALFGLGALTAAPIQWTAAAGGNDHFYELVDTGNFISWMTSQANAQAAGGYLATITSSPENDFIAALTGGLESYIGGTDAANEGIFEWVTGEPFGFTSWAFNEPNDDIAPASPTGEDYTIINPPGNPLGTWNDLPDQPLRVTAYVVEYDTTPLPEPSTLVLFSSCALVAAIRLRRRAGMGRSRANG